MRDFPGTPGTLTGLLLRISQCVFAAGSIAFMATTASFFNFTAFCYLIALMGLQLIWSSVLALLDVYSLVKMKALHNPVLVSLFVVGDWVSLYKSATLFSSYMKSVFKHHSACGLTAYSLNVSIGYSNIVSCSSFGLSSLSVLYFSYLSDCNSGEECQKYQIAVGLAYMSWLTIAISSLIMLWLSAAC
ncbi:unnamed protein product [Malus baccata var. baccata]